MLVGKGKRFSDRLEIRRPTEGLIYDDVPKPVHDAFLNLLGAVGEILAWGSEDWKRVYKLLQGSIDRWAPDTGYVVSLNTIGKELVRTCVWYEFYDLAEAVVQMLGRRGDLQAQFTNDFNQVLLRNYVGYEIRDGKVERVGAREAEVATEEARSILRDPELQAADEQFQKAIAFFNRRPQPDVENCVKNAVGAVEALAKILLENPSIQLNDAIKQIGEQKGVHKTLQQMVEKLYAYRGAAPGAAHGNTEATPPVSLPDAELVLHTSAACIVYLARLYGKAVG